MARALTSTHQIESHVISSVDVRSAMPIIMDPAYGSEYGSDVWI